MSKLISIVVPVYNNADSLNELDTKIRKHLKNAEFEIIYVNDDSFDESEKIILDLCNLYDNTQLVNLEKNYGQEGAVKAGLTVCSGEYVIAIDADLQDPPEILEKFLEFINQGYDVIIAARNSLKESFFRRLSSKFHHYIMKKIMPEYPKNGFNVFALSKKFYKYIIQDQRFVLHLDVFHFTRNIKIFNYNRNFRSNGPSQSKFIDRLNKSIFLISTLTHFPLRVCLLVGFLIFLFSLIYIFLIILGYLINSEIPNFTGWSPIMILILFFGGLSLFFIGILGEYLFIALKHTKNRKKFFIKNIYKNK